MGYWGFGTTESDSALDYLGKVTEHLEKMWDEATDHGENMAIIYILSEAPLVDMTDYVGLKDKAVEYLTGYSYMLYVAEVGVREYNKQSTEEIQYLVDLANLLLLRHGTTLVSLNVSKEERKN
jgi:hypothetical protein